MFSNSEKLDSSIERLRESSLSLKAPTVYLSHFNSCQVMHSRLLPQCKQSFSGNHESVLAAGKAKFHLEVLRLYTDRPMLVENISAK